MGNPEPTTPLPLARLAGVGLVVFLANAALRIAAPPEGADEMVLAPAEVEVQ